MSTFRVEPGFRFGAAYLAAGIVVTGVYFALPGGTAQSVVEACLGGTAAIAVLAGVRLHRPRTPVPWILFALATALFVAGDVAWAPRRSATAPSAADWCYLAGYPLLAGALLTLLVHAGGRHRIAAVGEAGIAAFAFALVQWVFFVHPALDGSGALSTRIVDATFPAGDGVLLAGFAGFFVSAAWRTPAFLLLVAGGGAALVGDDVYGRTSASYVAGSWLDATWMVSYVLFAAAALHPSMRGLSEPRRVPRLRVSASRIVLLTAALLTPATILLVQWARGARLEIPAVFAAAALISLLVVWRLIGILRALERLHARERESRAEAVAAHTLLAERNERLLEADRLKDEFVALISHDLRTPLTSIIGYTELALDESGGGPLDPERKSYLSVVARSSERLLRLVDDLLFVARLRAGRGLELDVKELDLAAIAQQSAVEAHPRAQAKHLELHYEGVDAAPVRADRGRMFQLLDNLIANAIKFTPAGGRVAVHVEALPDTVVLEVRDTGIGMSPEDAGQLFDRFFRTERASTEQIPGTGLGLYIARAIVEAHRGSISAAPRPERGTVFRIELPAAAAAARLRGGATELSA
jgi:signal transduction histidine kinase